MGNVVGVSGGSAKHCAVVSVTHYQEKMLRKYVL
jgi:hypothetical protein